MKKFKKATAAMICLAEVLFLVGGATACAVKGGAAAQQETKQEKETQQETASLYEAQQTTAQSGTTQQNTTQQNATQPDRSGSEQISLDDAKNAALTDAGLSDADVIFTKEKSDYENGIAVYDIEFYAGDVEYEYEINAATGAIYSKNMETRHNQTGHGHEVQTGASDSDIGADNAKSIALNHAGFSEADVSRLKCAFDMDDGKAVYEVEFDKDGKEYEYTISAADGTILEYDMDR